MKKLLNISQQITMGVILICITSFNNSASAIQGDPDENKGVVTESIIKPSFRTIESRVFVNWKITGLTKDCLFLVQRSIEDGDFETLEIKHGISGDVSLTVLYCYIDGEHVEGVVKYQVKRINIGVKDAQGVATRD